MTIPEKTKKQLLLDNESLRKRIESLENQSGREKESRRIIEHVSDIIAIVDRNWTIRSASPSFKRWLDYDPSEAVGEKALDFVHPDDVALTIANLETLAVRPGGMATIHVRIRHRNGTYRHFESHCTNHLDDPGIAAIVTSSRDITERMEAEFELRKSAESYRLLFEYNPYPMWVFDRETLQFVAVNKAAVNHYGYSADEFLAMKITDIRPEEDAPRLLDSVQNLTHGVDYTGAWRHTVKSGAEIFVEITSHSINFDGRKLELVLSQDVTLQKEVEESLRVSEEKYHSLFTSMSEGVVIVQPIFGDDGNVSDFELLDFNPVFQSIFGYNKGKTIGKRGSEFVRHKQLSYYTGIISHVLMLDRPYTFEVNFDKLGMVCKASVFEFGGGIIAAIFEDITERKIADDALSANHTRLESMLSREKLVAETASALNTTQPFGDIIESILDRLRSELNIDLIFLCDIDADHEPGFIARRWSSPARCDGDDDIVRFLTGEQIIRDYVLAGKEFFYPVGDASGSGDTPVPPEKDKRSLAVLSLNIGGTVRGMMSFIRNSYYEWQDDETGIMRTVAEIIANAIEREYNVQARLDAERKQTLAVRMAERASRLASLGTMAAGIAHEINQPLNALSFAVDGVRYWKKRDQEISPETLNENLDFISSQVSRISDIISNMRSLARLEKTTEAEPVSLNDVVTEVVSLVRQQFKVHNIEVELDLGSGLPPVLAQRARIQQIVTNLVVNAFQSFDGFDRKDKQITIATALSGDTLQLTVRDNGPGISQHVADNIFDPFVTTKTGADAMGLGLFITHSVITELDGIITAENHPGGGALFTVSMPSGSTERERP